MEAYDAVELSALLHAYARRKRYEAQLIAGELAMIFTNRPRETTPQKMPAHEFLRMVEGLHP